MPLYGLPLPKAWAFWANFSVLAQVACRCPHPPRFHPSFAGRRNADGSFATRQTACYPDALAAAIATQIAPFLSVRSAAVSFGEWPSLLPPSFVWPQPSGRIEDGAGTCSSAFWDPESLTSSNHCVRLGCTVCRRRVSCPACSLTLFHLARNRPCPSLLLTHFCLTFVHSCASGTMTHGPNCCMLIRDSLFASTFGTACLCSLGIRIWTSSAFSTRVSLWALVIPFRLAKYFFLRIRVLNPSYLFSAVTRRGSPPWTMPI